MDKFVDCSKVYVKTSTFSTPINKFLGVFAKQDFKKGDLIEKGVVRLLSNNDNKCFDGMNNQYVFTWSDELPNYTWAIGSGCSTFYNCNSKNDSNTNMIRYYREKTFEIYASKNIKKDEELTHVYKSLSWRSSFKNLNTILNNK